jgi:hypothetical protein
MSVQGRRIVRMRVTDPAIYNITHTYGSPHEVTEGFIVCQEYTKTKGDNAIDNQVSPNNMATSIWKVLVPHYLNLSTQSPSPDYKEGDLIYAAALDSPVIIRTALEAWTQNDDSSVNADGNSSSRRIPSLSYFAQHYGLTSVDPKANVVFWVDLNVDGRTTGAGSGGGGGSTSVVWL